MLSFQLQFPKQTKKTDLFQIEPKQTKNGLKKSKSTQKDALFLAAFSETNQKTDLFQNEPKQTENGLNFIAISLKF